MKVELVLVTVSILLQVARGYPVSGQEPAFVLGAMAIRYAEAPGDFHYVIPCKQPVGGTPEVGAPVATAPMGPALCWPVLAGRVLIADGKQQSAPPMPGTFMVSASMVRFLPDDARTRSPMPETQPEQITFRYDPRQIIGILSTKDATYEFAFRSFCLGCTPGTSALDLHKTAQLDAEYREFGDSLKQFEAISKRIHDLSAQMRVGVTPANQPNQKNSAEAMRLYGDLNHKLAPQCPESERACLQSYEKYQVCEGGGSPANCGEPPSCSAFCAIKLDVVQELQATWCSSRTSDSATLIPDWSGFLAVRDAERAASGPQGIRLIKEDATATTLATQNPCSVEAGYNTAFISHSGKQAMAGGFVGGGIPYGQSPGNQIKAAPPMRLSIASGVMAGNLLDKTVPIYPAVAKAARVQGTVVLQCTISKAGFIVDLHVISGPPLLQQAALDAVKIWRYNPYLLNGDAIMVETTVNVVFNLAAADAAQTVDQSPQPR